MKLLLICFLGTVSVAVCGMTKEKAIKKVQVRLVRKDWRPKGFDPGTDDPLPAFPGNTTQLYTLFKNYKRFEYVAQPLINATKLFDDPNYNASLPSLILTHPMSFRDSVFITFTVGVLSLRNLQKHYNIFAMHSPRLSVQFQTSCARTTLGLKTFFEPVSEAFASFLLDGISLEKLRADQINFIGFSYSATLNAYIARVIRDNTGQLTHTILALDAFQHNYGNDHFKQISADDALFVHIIHSSSRLGGTTKRLATVDIVLNNGYIQPGCNGYFKSLGCSHRRSVAVYIFALVSMGNVIARKCDNWEMFSQCQCNDITGHPMLIVSFPVNQEARGVFYARTGNHLPYSLGPQGAYCEADAAKPLPQPFTNKV